MSSGSSSSSQGSWSRWQQQRTEAGATSAWKGRDVALGAGCGCRCRGSVRRPRGVTAAPAEAVCMEAYEWLRRLMAPHLVCISVGMGSPEVADQLARAEGAVAAVQCS